MKNFQVNSEGYYGEFGGAHIPDALRASVDELTREYLKITSTPDFKAELDQLLRDYVGRPSPLFYAQNLSEKYGARIYLKREDLNHTGAHKINNALGQALMAKRMGKTRIIAETGAGQHGVATATVCALLGLSCVVYMGQGDILRQRLNVRKMEMLGAEVRPVTTGGADLKQAVDEAINDWCMHLADTHYIIGSAVGPHPFPDMVARFQSVISEEIKTQLLQHEGREYPDHLIACVGGGSNAAGAFFHYLDDPRVNLILAEGAGMGLHTPENAATLLMGKPGTLHGMQTYVIQDESGEPVDPYSISAGLDYPGIGPLHAHLAASRRVEVLGVTDEQALKAAMELTRLEGIIPALESSHALGTFQQRTFQPGELVVVNLSGRGDKDMDTYDAHFNPSQKPEYTH